MDSTTTTTTSVSSTTSTPPIAYPSSHINSPVLNNNWADEVEAFFGDGIIHYPDNEPTLQPQLADFTDLELNLSDDEDMFSPPTVRFQFPSRATPSTSANKSTPKIPHHPNFLLALRALVHLLQLIYRHLNLVIIQLLLLKERMSSPYLIMVCSPLLNK